MRRTLSATAVACAALLALPAASRADRHTQPADPVVAWNQFLLGIQATPGAQPATVHATYDLAIMHAAIYDAVAAIDHSAPRRTGSGSAPRAAHRFRPRSTPPRTARSRGSIRA
jgi:hypothetical protein